MLLQLFSQVYKKNNLVLSCQVKELNYRGSNFFKDQDEGRLEIVANDFSPDLGPLSHS